MKKILFPVLLFLLTSLLIALSIKGASGNPLAYQDSLQTGPGGPFESSGSNSRYALTKSIIEDKSFFLSTELAKFASPDLVEYQGKYSTLFTPGVSFAAVPFYYLGLLIGFPQLLSFLSTSIFAVLNIYLVYLISKKLGVNNPLSAVSGLTFGFATTALAYSNTLTQHHLSVTVILLTILNSLGKRTLRNNLLLGMLFGAGVLIDIPNMFMMLPIGLYVFAKHFNQVGEGKNLKLNINFVIITILIGLMPMVTLFGWYNKQTLGKVTSLAQSIGRTDNFATEEIKKINEGQQTPKENKPLLPFETRNQLRGFYILLFSNERGIFYYNPIVIFGILGLILAYKNRINNDLVVLITATVMVNVLIYSMFGDPWGGWSFGPRYMIPTLALLSAGIGLSLSRFSRNPFFVAAFIIVLIYSVGVNVLGSTTTNLVPPKVEALNLAVPIPYTYEYNYQLAQANKSGALVYNVYFKSLINVKTYIYFYSTLILTVLISLFGVGLIFKERRTNG